MRLYEIDAEIQAHKLTDLRDRNLAWIDKYREAEKKYQGEAE